MSRTRTAPWPVLALAACLSTAPAAAQEPERAPEIDARVLHIRADHVIEDMVRKLGATVRSVDRPFNPEGGAYGHGAVSGHSHGQGHGHSHGDGHHHHH